MRHAKSEADINVEEGISKRWMGWDRSGIGNEVKVKVGECDYLFVQDEEILYSWGSIS